MHGIAPFYPVNVGTEASVGIIEPEIEDLELLAPIRIPIGTLRVLPLVLHDGAYRKSRIQVRSRQAFKSGLKCLDDWFVI